MAIPLVELYVKASPTDAGDKGACPFSQKWFMVLYILVEKQMINLRVIPVSMATPPADYIRLQTGKRIPAIAFYADHDDGATTTNPDFVIAGNDELEEFVRERYSQELNVDADEQWIGADLLKNLNQFLRTGVYQPILTILATLNEHLAKTQTTFLEGTQLAYSDCVLACKLQHTRIAGAFFHGFEIPKDLAAVYEYLREIYSTKAFDVSCPLDRDILMHYMDKVDFVDSEAKKQAHGAINHLPEGQKTTSLSDDSPVSLRVPQIPLSGIRLSVISVMPIGDYEKSVAGRLSQLFETRLADRAESLPNDNTTIV